VIAFFANIKLVALKVCLFYVWPLIQNTHEEMNDEIRNGGQWKIKVKLSPISQEVSKQRIEHVANSKSCVSVHTGYGAFFASYFNNCKKMFYT